MLSALRPTLLQACLARALRASSAAALAETLCGCTCSHGSHGRCRDCAAGRSGWPAAAGAASPPPLAAAARAQLRQFHAAAAARKGSPTEDFDLIAPDVGLARIDGLDDSGFIVNDVQVEGSVMLSGDVFTLWSARRLADVSLDSLSLLRLLKPVPDLLVVGCGRRVQQLPPELSRQLHEMGVRVDAMDTANAVATFNVLNQEGRKVVGALLPQGADD